MTALGEHELVVDGGRAEQPPPEVATRPSAPDARRSSPRLAHQPALDGLRGLAVLAVLLYHAALLDDLPGLGRWISGGFLGVSAFFTLSGFLITSLLVLEYERHGDVSLGSFWGRRFRRLMPASLLLIASVVVLTPLVGTDQQVAALPGDVWSALAYVFNWHSIIDGSDYAATFATSQSPLKHVWSLSVEEQWYLLLPVLVASVLWLARGRRRGLVVVYGLVAVASTALMWNVGGGEYTNRAYLGTDTRLAEMAIGGLLAALVAGRALGAGRRIVGRLVTAFLNVTSLVVLAVLLTAWMTAHIEDDWLYRGGFALHAVCVAIVIAAAVRPGTVVHRLLAVRPLTGLGRISYGAYLFHWPVLLWLTADRLGVSPQAAPFIQLPITIALAWVSYRFLEGPIRNGRLVVGWRRVAVPALAIGAIAVLVVLLPNPDPSRITALDDTTEISSSKQLQSSERMFVPSTTAVPDPVASTAPSATPTTTAPPPPPPVRILFSGDSFAMSIMPGVRTVAEERGDFSFITTAMVGCGFGRGGRNRGIGLTTGYSRECQQRDQWVTAAIGHLHPDVVVLAGGLWDVTDRQPEGFSRWTHIGDPAYDLFLAGEIRHMVSLVQTEGAQVVWLDAPHWDPHYTPGNFMGRPPYPEADPTRVDRYNALLAQTLAGLPNVRIVSIADWARAQPGGELAPTLRADGVHFTETSSTAAAEWLVPQLIDIGRASPVTVAGATSTVGDLTSPTTG